MGINCNYCGNPAKIINGSTLYNKNNTLYSNRYYWQCKPCRAYVGCHPSTKIPLGTLANSTLRKSRGEFHRVFDTKWKIDGMTRNNAYSWLASQLSISKKECHGAMFDLVRCKQAIIICSNKKRINMNNNLVLVSGATSTGKSMCLRHINDHPGVMYLNCENNKSIPFKHKFKTGNVLDPYQVYASFDKAEALPEIHTIVIDTLTYLMDMFETKYILDSSIVDTQAAWGQYSEFFKKLMNTYVAKSTKRIIIMGHTVDVYNKEELVTKTMVKVKGSIMNRGIESAFSNVISTKRMSIESLTPYSSPMLNITEDEAIDGFKYVFQTRLTKDTIGECIRSPIDMWSRKETYIDNDITHVLNRIKEYNT